MCLLQRSDAGPREAQEPILRARAEEAQAQVLEECWEDLYRAGFFSDIRINCLLIYPLINYQ